MTKHYISYYSINEWRMKLVIQLYTWEIFMFIPVNKYRICDSPGYVYAKCMHMLVEYTFRKHFNIFPDQKSIETRRKKYMHARARRRGEKKKEKAWIKWEKEGKSGKPRIELVERKERRGRARKRAVLHAFAFSLLAAFVPVVFLQLLVSNLYHAIFHPMKFVSSPIYENEGSEARETPSLPPRFFWMRGHEPMRWPTTHDSRTRVKKKKKTALLGKRKFIP